MFTRNWWKYQAAEMVGKASEIKGGDQVKPSFITVSGDVGPDKYNASGYNYSISYYPCVNDLRSALKHPVFADVSQNIQTTKSGLTFSGCGVFFGSGNTAATIDDYKLEGTILTNCTCSYTDGSYFESDGSSSTNRFTYTITNNNDTDITIGEIGLFCEYHNPSKKSYSTYDHVYYMFERTALENPIAIPANGGVGQVTYAVQLDYPVA